MYGRHKLKRRLSGFDATTVVVSDMVGTGIFFTTGWIALNIITGPGIIAAWLTGGILALFGALSYAELSTTFPRSGGEYNYLREAYGPLFGFLSGWTSLFIGFSAPIAIGALGFTAYLSFFWPSLSAENVIFSGLGITLTNASAFALATIITLMFFHFLGRGTDRRVQVFFDCHQDSRYCSVDPRRRHIWERKYSQHYFCILRRVIFLNSICF